MQIIRWKFENADILMVEDSAGELHCTTNILAAALGVTSTDLQKIYSTRPEDFDDVRLTTSEAKSFLGQHKTELGIRRLRSDMHLWTEDDVITFIVISRTEQGRQFRKAFKAFVKEHRTKNLVTQQELAVLANQVEELQRLLRSSQPALHTAASAAGTALNAQKKIRQLHLLN